MRQLLLVCAEWIWQVCSRTLESATAGLVGSSPALLLEGLEGRTNPASLQLVPLSSMPLLMDAPLTDAALNGQQSHFFGGRVEVESVHSWGLVREAQAFRAMPVVDELFCSLADRQMQETTTRHVALDCALSASNEISQTMDTTTEEKTADAALLGWAFAGGALLTTWWVGNEERWLNRRVGLRAFAA
ncbi:MAG: hypothetical protein NTV55_03755 [Planctomycetota bacterium]|nr:hypothetical protein [Planctomycetota bacterium]